VKPRHSIFHALTLAALGFANVYGYELATHGRLTEQAYLQSNLVQDTQLLGSLGLTSGDVNPFGHAFYDVSGSQIKERQTNDFEKTKGLMVDPREALTVKGWLMRGAIREDDVPWPFGEGNPQDDPYGNIFRVFNHFYDPVHDQPLNISGVTPGSLLGQPNLIAPQWALGSSDVFNLPGTPDSQRRNHFTAFDAREAMYRALTGYSTQGDTVAATQDERNKYWATTFRALGDIVHLIQDMGQPQHTRNDRHSGKYYDGSGVFEATLGHKSVYENYIDARAKGAAFAIVSAANPANSSLVITSGLTYSGYPIPSFDHGMDFFTTHRSDGNQSGRGLADYSNRSFFSAGTNLGMSSFTAPDNDSSNYMTQQMTTDWQGNPLAGGGSVTLLKHDVPDPLNPSQAAAAVPLTTVGVWDQFLKQQNYFPEYSLNVYNYDAMANLLIPRAVAYSAGFINYFFRARITIQSWIGTYDNISNQPAYSIGVRNVSASGNDMSNGKFEVFYDATDGTRKRLPLLNGTDQVGSTALVTGATQTLTAQIPTDRDSAKPYIFVFTGTVGKERAIAGVVYSEADLYILDEARGWGLYRFSANGDYITTYSAPGEAPLGVSVYGSDYYHTSTPIYASEVYGGFYRNGIQMANPELPTDTGANSTRVYVATATGSGATTAIVEAYDHNGVHVGSLLTNPDYWFYGGSLTATANDTRLITASDETTYIYSLDGQLVREITGANLGSNAIDVTKDRIYRANNDVTHFFVDIYALDGQHVGTFGNITDAQLNCIAVGETEAYLVTGYPNRIYIYNREVVRDTTGSILSDRYTLNKTVDISSFTRYPNTCSIDRKSIPLK